MVSGLKKFVLFLRELNETFLLGFTLINAESLSKGMSTFFFPLSSKPSFGIFEKLTCLYSISAAFNLLSFETASVNVFVDVASLSLMKITNFNAIDFSELKLLRLPKLEIRYYGNMALIPSKKYCLESELNSSKITAACLLKVP